MIRNSEDYDESTKEDIERGLLPIDHPYAKASLRFDKNSKKLLWDRKEVVTTETVKLARLERFVAIFTFIFVAFGGIGALISGLKDGGDACWKVSAWFGFIGSACVDVKEEKPSPSAPLNKPDLSGIIFGSDSSVLTARTYPILEKAAQWIRSNPSMRVLVRGYSDSSGGLKKNLIMSNERAIAVRGWLIDVGGVDAARVLSQGEGISNPVADNNTIEGREKNRRVEIVPLQ